MECHREFADHIVTKYGNPNSQIIDPPAKLIHLCANNFEVSFEHEGVRVFGAGKLTTMARNSCTN